MDCNKEEALRAKTMAENLMRNSDFAKAQNLVMKAQRLFSGLDSLQQMLAVCDVHCSAEKKISGLENWYGILQVMHFSDDATIKKQYKKLALLLHPDKNKFAGAEAAFKLIGEANRLLADKEKRTQYDIKHRIYSRVARSQLNANSGAQCGAANNANDSIGKNSTFWTCCEHCGYRYKYLRLYVDTKMFCSKCQRSFMAYDTGFNGVPPKSNTSVNGNVGSTGAQPGSVAAEVDKEGTSKEKFNKKNEGGENQNAEVRKPKLEDESMKNCAESSKPEEGEGKMNNTAELPKDDCLKPQPEVAEPEKGASKSVPDESVSRPSQAPSMNKDKNKRRKLVEELTEDKADSKDNSRRRSPRISQRVSCAEKGRNDDAVSPPAKRTRSNYVLKSEGSRKRQHLSVGSSKRLGSGGSNGKAKKNVDSGYQKISSTGDKKSKARGEGMSMPGKIDNNYKPIRQDPPDPDFNNFELRTSSFAVNQVWSLYDSTDGMPRLYARIEKVIDSEFKLRITWLDPLHDNSTPIGCGIFQDAESEEVDDRLIFSWQMHHIPRDNNIVIYPRTGEVWAVFRGWDISWSGHSENHKDAYEYDFVEVLCDFKDVDGLGVAYLGKVEGFVSLFRREAKYGVLQLQIPPNEMARFSHKVPSFKMTGKERESVPPGCFELDTAALPKDMFEVPHSKADVGLDRQRSNGKTGGLISEASKVEVRANTTLDCNLAPKKRQKVNDNHSSFSNASEGVCSSHEMKKSRKSVKVVDDLKLRKSPRFLSETNNQTTSRPGQEKAEKKSANGGTSGGQPNGFCFSDETMTTPKKSANVTAADSSRIRNTHQNIHKPTGSSKRCGRNGESLSLSRGNDMLTRLNGSIKSADLETHRPSNSTTGQENSFNFENQRSVDKFQIDQIWAIYSSDEGMPRKYAQIKRIDRSPEFKLHVAPLQLYRSPNLMTHPVCCGCFKLKTGKADVLEPSSFSHQVKAVKSNINRYEIYPGKGEIWAMYKNMNTKDGAETEELEIVEVVETNKQSTQVVLLTVFNKLLYGRSQESKASFVDIPRADVSRFSHQIPAFRQERRATRFGDREYWELDPKAVVDLNSKKP